MTTPMNTFVCCIGVRCAAALYMSRVHLTNAHRRSCRRGLCLGSHEHFVLVEFVAELL